MFDTMNITKEYTMLDNINNVNIPIATFNAQLYRDSGIKVSMNITYPNLYHIHKDNILLAYREFNSNVVALATTMGLATTVVEEPSILDDLVSVREELTIIAKEVFNDVIGSLSTIHVNAVPNHEIR